MSMQLQLNPKRKKKRKLLENHKLMEQAIEQENKEVQDERTRFHGRHLSSDPL
jgi:hypothetical protein